MKQKGRRVETPPEERKRTSGVVLSVLVLSFTAFAAIRWQDKQVVTAVRAQGVTALSAGIVQGVLDSCLQMRRGVVDLATVRDRLESIPFVQGAYVYFDGVRSLTAVVQERYPVGHIVLPDGSVRYLDKSGTILPKAQVRTVHDVPLVRRADKAQLTQNQRIAVARLLETAREKLSTVLYESVSEVTIADHCTLMRTQFGTWRLCSAGVDNGTCERSMQAFEKLSVYAQHAGMRSGQVVDLDLRWDKHVVVKRLG